MGVKFVAKLNQNSKLTTVWAVLFIAACTTKPVPQQEVTMPAPLPPEAVAPAPPEPVFVGCANSDDMRAVKAAAIGQRLMVASYACHATDSYRDFIEVYRADLRNSDFALQDFFRRMNRGAGDRAYDTYKTRLANSAMLDNIADNEGYCASTDQAFSAALSLPSRELDLFLLTQDFPLTERVSPCNLASPRRENSGVSLVADVQR